MGGGDANLAEREDIQGRLMLFLKERIEESIEILKMYEPPEGYYLAFSGGKDSVVLYDVTMMANVKFESHYQITTADPPEVVQFIHEHYPYTQMERPAITMWELIAKKLLPPTRKYRYCCDWLKERGGGGRTVLTGVKKTDSQKRCSTLVRICQKKGKIIINPLLNWCDDEIWEHIKTNKLPYCSLYDEGFTRLGCIGCPLAADERRRIEFQRWPKYRQAYLRAFDRMLKERARKSKPTEWKTAEEVMSWWLQEDVGGGDAGVAIGEIE